MTFSKKIDRRALQKSRLIPVVAGGLLVALCGACGIGKQSIEGSSLPRRDLKPGESDSSGGNVSSKPVQTNSQQGASNGDGTGQMGSITLPKIDPAAGEIKSSGEMVSTAPSVSQPTNSGTTGSNTTPQTSTQPSTMPSTMPSTTPAPGSTPQTMPPATSADLPSPGADYVPVFVAQGQLGRTVVSCDAGQSWIFDRSWNDAGSCGGNCDHGPNAASGLAYGDGMFFATYGHGAPSKMLSSSDGQTWQTILENGGIEFDKLAYGDGYLFGGEQPFTHSADKGKTWVHGKMDSDIVRGAFALKLAAGWRFFLNGDAPTGLLISDDHGGNWTKAKGWVGQCETRDAGVVGPGGVMVTVDWQRPPCYSTDGGMNWKRSSYPDSFTTLAATNNLFYASHGDGIYTSSDGNKWTKSSATGTNGSELIRYHPALKVFVAVVDAYGSQKFMRSTDGITWTTLAAGKFKGGHPIGNIVPGYLKKSAQCKGL